MPAPAFESPLDTMQRINRTWLDGRAHDLVSFVHPDIVMVFPGFSGRIEGREAFIAGFRDFCENARIDEFAEDDYQSDTAGDTAVVTFRYAMLYERSGERFRATGRDLWVFHKQSDGWIATWRAMLEIEEQPA